jgi:hypothetical protein
MSGVDSSGDSSTLSSSTGDRDPRLIGPVEGAVLYVLQGFWSSWLPLSSRVGGIPLLGNVACRSVKVSVVLRGHDRRRHRLAWDTSEAVHLQLHRESTEEALLVVGSDSDLPVE